MTATLLNFYIARRFAVTVAIMLVVVGLIAFLADYLEVLRRYANAEGFTTLLGPVLSAMRVLVLLETLLPFAFLFGAVVSLIDLSRRSELVVARASGVSAWQFLLGPLVVAALFGIFASTVLNPVAVNFRQHAAQVEAELDGKPSRIKGHWFRQEVDGIASIVNAGSASEDGRVLSGVVAFVFNADGSFREKVAAPRAEYEAGSWVFADATILSAAEPQHVRERYELPTRLRAAELRRSFAEPDSVSVWSLPGFIDTAQRAGLDADRFRVAFHKLLNRPLMLLAMVLIAATVSLRLSRHGGVWRLVLTGAAIGFLLYAASEIVSDLGANGIINPVLAAWLPPLVALTLGATALLYQEDG